MEWRRILALLILLTTSFFAGFGIFEQPPNWYGGLKRPEWWQVIVAVVGIGVIAWQAWLTRKAVEAAEIGAKAAKDNIELLISKERARLVVDLDDLELIPHQGIYEVTFKVSILGSTPAFIVDTKCAAYVVPEEFVAHEETSDRVMFSLRSLPSTIPINFEPIKEFAILFLAKEDDSEAIIAEVMARRLFVGIRGVIVYKDVFDRERETSFRYVWRPSLISGIGGEWMRCGKAEENRAT